MAPPLLLFTVLLWNTLSKSWAQFGGMPGLGLGVPGLTGGLSTLGPMGQPVGGGMPFGGPMGGSPGVVGLSLFFFFAQTFLAENTPKWIFFFLVTIFSLI